MTEAQEILLENCLFGNVRVFLEIGFQRFGVGFVRCRDVTHFVDPSDYNEMGRSMPLNSLTSYRWHIYMSSNVDLGATVRSRSLTIVRDDNECHFERRARNLSLTEVW